MATVSSVDVADQEEAPEIRRVTVDQIVAVNMRYWRRIAGLTQEELGHLIGWSAANVSAAERSADGDRERRRFDAGTLAALAFALGVPLAALFLPPPDESPGARHVIPALPGDPDGDTEYDMSQLLSFVVVPDSGEPGRVMDAYRYRFASIADLLLDTEAAKDVARMLSLIEAPERLSSRVDAFRESRAALLRAAAEFGDMADVIEEHLGGGQ